MTPLAPLDGHRVGPRRQLVVALAVALALSSGCAPSSARSRVAAPTAAEPTVAFTQVNVIDVTSGRVRRDQTVLVTGARITVVGPTDRIAVPPTARVVQARGQYLIPGLWDMHSHVGAMALPAEQSAVMRNAHVLLLAHGITGIRDAATSVPLDSLIAWRRAILAGQRVGPPRQLLAGRSLEEHNGVAAWTHLLEVPTPADARRAVDSLLAAGADHIKVHDFGNSSLVDSLVAALRQRGVLFGGHLDTAAVGARFLDHGFGLTGSCRGDSAGVARCRSVAERMRREDMWYVANPLPIGGGHVALSRAWSGLPSAQQQARLLPLLLDMALGAPPSGARARTRSPRTRGGAGAYGSGSAFRCWWGPTTATTGTARWWGPRVSGSPVRACTMDSRDWSSGG